MKENLVGAQLYLAPEEESAENAKETTQASKNDKKYIFRITYEPTEKSVVLSKMEKLEAEILDQSDLTSCVTVRVSISQLAAIKALNCIEKVEVAEESVSVSSDENPVLKTAEKNGSMNTETGDAPLAMSSEATTISSTGEEISVMCYDDATDCNYDNSNTMQTAIYLPLSVWTNGCICCAGSEIWYQFTADISNADTYTIYTSGTLDTRGYLYDANGSFITSDDDGGDSLNFSITEKLTYGATYYVKVNSYGNGTGDYSIRVRFSTIVSGDDGECESDCSNTMATAVQLSLNSWQSGEIRCPGAEMWYKFTPNTTAYYTIYTDGSLDTIGYLYDSGGNQIISDDDNGPGLNFRIAQSLTAGQTYYIKVNT